MDAVARRVDRLLRVRPLSSGRYYSGPVVQRVTDVSDRAFTIVSIIQSSSREGAMDLQLSEGKIPEENSAAPAYGGSD